MLWTPIRKLEERSAAAIVFTAARNRRDPGPKGSRAGNKRQTVRQEQIPSSHRCERVSTQAHSTGTTISLARTMLRRARAADSIARGSVRKRRTSVASAAFVVRSVSTSVLIFSNCCDAARISARVRMVTLTQSANVARMIMAKTTHDGIRPPRRRTSVGVPTISRERSRTGPKEGTARGATCCARRRSSIQ